MRIPHPARFLSSVTQSYLSRYSPKPLSRNPKPIASFHFSKRCSFHMAGESESFTTAAASADDNAKYGFERSEMYQSKLAGTVDPPFQRHLFLCYKSPEYWPSRFEDSDADPLPKLLTSALKARREDIKIRTRLTICENGGENGFSDGDVLIFPEMILYRGLGNSDVDSFVDDVLVSGKPWQSGVQEELSGSFVFVCAHNNRDKRCGVCGPPLIQKFEEDIRYIAKHLRDQVFVTACSHIGGHKYAGNVIIFSQDADGDIAGNWYGYVTPNDTLELIQKQVLKGEVVERLWRGQMSANAEKVDKPKPSNRTSWKEPEEIDMVGCCHSYGYACCKDHNVENKAGNKEWEQRDVLTAAAVVGAVATVAVAYGVYRRSR